jgi:transposase-like protein
MSKKSSSKLVIRESRIFSEELKKRVVRDLISGRSSIKSIMAEHQVSSTSVYKWLYRYSAEHQPKCTLVVQMDSEEAKSHELKQKIAELERIVGQKQLEIDFLNRLIDIGSNDLGFDFKKNFSPKLSNGSDAQNKSTGIV